MPLTLLRQAGAADAREAAIRDTIAAVFRDHAYDRGIRESLWQRFAAWVARRFAELRELLDSSPGLGWALAVVTALLLVAIVARAVWVARLRARRRAELDAMGAGGARSRALGDPWQLAQRNAAEGRYTEAAHLLYLALLEAVARRERIRLHPSKTVGDYARELRRNSSSLFARYREFARSYETVVYGLGTCDRERWERLDALARDIVVPRG